MVRNELFHWWEAIQAGMKRRSSANPFSVSFARNTPAVIFNAILDIACTAMYGVDLKKSPAITVLKISKEAKLRMILNAMNIRGDMVVPIGDLLQKSFPAGELAKVFINDENQCMIRYNKNSERVTFSCQFGFWNSHGVPQHIWS